MYKYVGVLVLKSLYHSLKTRVFGRMNGLNPYAQLVVSCLSYGLYFIHALESCLLYRVQVCRGFSALISLSLTKNKGIWPNEWAKSLCSTKNVSRKLFKLWVLLNQILLHW